MTETYLVCLSISLVSIRLSIPFLTFFATKWVEDSYLSRSVTPERVYKKLKILVIILFVASLVPFINILTAVIGTATSVGTFLFTNRYIIKISKSIYSILIRILIGKGRD